MSAPPPDVSHPAGPGHVSRSAAVVTVSDGVARGVRDDAAGRAVAALLAEHGIEVGTRRVVPDERPEIEEALRSLAGAGAALVVTTGGTGLGPRDVTPEATRAVIEREVPGLAEEMRAAGRASTPFAALSRGVVGAVAGTLIVNLPGSERGARESLQAILPALPHALQLLAGDTVHGPADTPAGRHAGGRHARGEAHAHEREWRHEPSGRGATLEEQLVARRAAGEAVVLATAIRTERAPPCEVGQKLLLGPAGPVAGTLGCAEFDAAAAADAPRVLATGAPATEVYAHDLGTVEVYLEPFPPRPRLVVLSATPVGRALAGWAADLGFDATLVEPRSDRLRDAPAGVRVATALHEVALDADTAAVHTDHDAPFVLETLEALLRSPARFVGVMGSSRHVGPHLERLRDRGFDEADLRRVRTPVGLDIGARTAEEIALSILAGIVADRRGAAGGWLDR